jgi:hypothetical protein
MCEALSSILSIIKKKKKGRGGIKITFIQVIKSIRTCPNLIPQ